VVRHLMNSCNSVLYSNHIADPDKNFVVIIVKCTLIYHICHVHLWLYTPISDLFKEKWFLLKVSRKGFRWKCPHSSQACHETIETSHYPSVSSADTRLSPLVEGYGFKSLNVHSTRGFSNLKCRRELLQAYYAKSLVHDLQVISPNWSMFTW